MDASEKCVLITGSRDWWDPRSIQIGLQYARSQGCNLLLSGACPTGADAQAEEIWDLWDLPIRRFPAEWDAHGKKAGFLRNAQMVRYGAAMCLAFIRNESKGATMTADMAEKAGILTYRFEMKTPSWVEL